MWFQPIINLIDCVTQLLELFLIGIRICNFLDVISTKYQFNGSKFNICNVYVCLLVDHSFYALKRMVTVGMLPKPK